MSKAEQADKSGGMQHDGGDLLRLQSLAGLRDPGTLEELRALAVDSPDKAVRKEARRLLFKIGQSPARSASPAPAGPALKTVVEPRAYGSVPDGAGNCLMLVVIPDRDGGSPTLLDVLINDETGVVRCGSERAPRSAVPAHIENLYSLLSDGLAIAEIDMNLARLQLQQAADLSRQHRKQMPPGYIDWMERLGNADDRPVQWVSSQLSAAAGEDAPDPASLFDVLWFESWFFDSAQVAPLAMPMIEATDQGDEGDALKASALSVLMPPQTRERYVARLRYSAEVLARRNQDQAAIVALACAAELESEVPLERSRFALALLDRSVTAAAELLAGEDNAQDDETEPEG